MTRPLVSIGLPVHNGSGHVDLAITSLLAQTYTDIELVISENASTDDTYEICRRLADFDPRVRIVRQPSLLSAPDNFSAALAEARGEYFMFAAADDSWHPEFVAALVEELERRPDADVAMSGVDHTWWDARDDPQVVRFQGRLDPSASGPLRLTLRQAGGRVPYFQYLYGLHRTPFIRKALVRWPKTVSSDGLYAIQLALATRWCYVDRILTTRYIREAAWAERYEDDEMAQAMLRPSAEPRLVLTAALYLARSEVIPFRRKAWIPLIVLRFAGWRLPIFLVQLRDARRARISARRRVRR